MISFFHLDTADFDHNQTEQENELKAKVEARFRLLKQEFECQFTDLSDIELSKLKITRNCFNLNESICGD